MLKRWWRNMFPQYILEVNHRGIERRIHVVKFTSKKPKKVGRREYRRRDLRNSKHRTNELLRERVQG